MNCVNCVNCGRCGRCEERVLRDVMCGVTGVRATPTPSAGGRGRAIETTASLAAGTMAIWRSGDITRSPWVAVRTTFSTGVDNTTGEHLVPAALLGVLVVAELGLAETSQELLGP